MIKIKQVMLFTALLILLVGLASASEVSDDTISTDSITEKAVMSDTHKVSDTVNKIQENNVDENIITNKSTNKIDKNTIKTEKTASNTKKEEVVTVKNWEQLSDVMLKSENKKENFTIKLEKGIYTNTGRIKWTNNKIVLTINGNGQTINANQNQAFYVYSNAALVLKNLTIINGNTQQGGAIGNSGNVTIIDSIIANNSAIFDGGAIFNDGNLTIINSRLTNNFARETAGAIWNIEGNLTIVNSTLANNTAKDDGGAIQNSGSLSITQSTLVNNTGNNGGTIQSGGNLTITDSTIANSYSNFYGGAIYSTGRFTLINSKITNSTTNSAGGAISNEGSLTIVNSTLKNNEVVGLITFGGAIQNTGTLTVTNSILSNNRATNGGGAISTDKPISMTLSRLENNSGYNGGAIRINSNQYSNISSSNFTNNHAGVGGAICSNGYVNLTSNVFTNNTAETGETIDLKGYTNGIFNDNVYNSTDISFKSLQLSIKDNQTFFLPSEDVVLNFNTSGLEHPNYYDPDILEQLESVTIYINGVENITTKSDKYILSNLKLGKYEVYYKNAKQKSNNITFFVTSINNWQTLQEAVRDAQNQTEDTALYLMEGNYTNTGTIVWYNPKIVLSIDGLGQTIDANQMQTFINNARSSMILKNITIQNAYSKNGGAIENQGTLTIINSTLTNNTAEFDGGAIMNSGTLIITQSTLNNNTADKYGGAIRTFGTLNITQSTLANNTAIYGGAITNTRSDEYINIVKSNFTNNHAQRGGAIFSRGTTNLTNNTFTNNTADNTETIDLNGFWNGKFNNNTYKSTDVLLKNIDLKLKNYPKEFQIRITDLDADRYFMMKNNQTVISTYEKLVLNYNITLENPNYYDKNILKTLDDITLYVNGEKYATTKYNDYTLSYLKPGEYTVYIQAYNQKSNPITFTVIDMNKIKLTTWDVEMVQGKGVTFSARVDYMNQTVNYGHVYFKIYYKTLLDKNGAILHVPVIDNWAHLPYVLPSDIELGEHLLTAGYVITPNDWARNEKTLTIIENIPEGAGDGGDEIPSKEEKQETYTKDTRAHKTIVNTIQSNIPTMHQIIVGNMVIPADNVITLGELNEIFGQTFTNGHLLLYIDGQLVYNGTVGDDLATVLLEIIEKFLGEHELKVEFTDADGKTNTYNKTIIIG